MAFAKIPIEAHESWVGHLKRLVGEEEPLDFGSVNEARSAKDNKQTNHDQLNRYLKSHHSHHRVDDPMDMMALEQQAQEAYLEREQMLEADQLRKTQKHHKKHAKKVRAIYKNPGIDESTVHGIMMDAGSTGTRLSVYEFEPRVLHNEKEVEEAVSGRKISYPGTESRWTDRLRPGLASFATIDDDTQLETAIRDYLSGLMEFALSVLHNKESDHESFPIYIRATGGMRTLTRSDRARVIKATRTVFSNKTFCPFYFTDEHARVISGEEEAIYGWAGVNFVLGTLIEDSAGAGTVLNPTHTYGALDLGGASTQISFFEPTQDIMSDLFNLQIGQGKHWNVYAHSFLYYGINEAKDRLHALLIDGKSTEERLVQGVHNPCLPGGASLDVHTEIQFTALGMETWNSSPSDDAEIGTYFNAIMKNDEPKGDFEQCAQLATTLLHTQQNVWCQFSHRGDCSFAGVYQPQLPERSNQIGEFLAFSNFYHVWNFLDLPPRSSMADLKNATRMACSLNRDEVRAFAGDRVEEEYMDHMCFHASYAWSMLTAGYGFEEDDYITATNVVEGKKLGWHLGAMMYEINTLPWKYVRDGHSGNKSQNHSHSVDGPTTIFFALLILSIVAGLVSLFAIRSRRQRYLYEPIKNHQGPF